jgi:hypothetical protein
MTYSKKRGWVPNAKMHLVLIPVVFALRLNTAIFACLQAKNAKHAPKKSLRSPFFRGGCVNDAAPFWCFMEKSIP